MIRARSVGVIDLGEDYALVDAEDAEEANRYRWRKHVFPCGRFIATASIDRRNLFMHRAIVSAPSGFEVDHINGDTLDNRKCNLRICTRAQNGANIPTRRDGFKGVWFRKDTGKWAAEISPCRKKISLGSFLSEEEAARAYDAAARLHYGDYARLNFPNQAEAPKFARPRMDLDLPNLAMPRAARPGNNNHTGARPPPTFKAAREATNRALGAGA
jgi:hypothetical protein